MREEELQMARRISREIAATVPPPLFYEEKAAEVEQSRSRFEQDGLVQECMRLVGERYDRMGHGLEHVRKVAVDAGAVVLIEQAGSPTAGAEGLLRLAHLAGALHDVKRDQPDHARRGAEEATAILTAFGLDPREVEEVSAAIRNHEAFRPAEELEEPSCRLLSDSLYDADKFRWGPDNFTCTVWSMVAPVDIPLSVLLDHFLPSLGGIERIKSTFRTATGKRYGPDFIERGLEIGMRIYRRLAGELGKAT
jgi:hypothetical protein